MGPHKKGTALAGDTTSDLVVLMKNVPTEANMSNTMQKVYHYQDTTWSCPEVLRCYQDTTWSCPELVKCFVIYQDNT